jgi:hypothetical protein
MEELPEDGKDLNRVENIIIDLHRRNEQNQLKSFLHYRAFLKARLDPNSKLAKLQKEKEKRKIDSKGNEHFSELTKVRQEIENLKNHQDILQLD